jgi:hypothetical protein
VDWKLTFLWHGFGRNENCNLEKSKRLINKQEIAKAIAVAIFMKASFKIGWTNIYTKIFMAFFLNKKSLKNPKKGKEVCEV